MLGQANHFLKFAAEDVPYGKNRYRSEAHRIYGVMDKRLETSDYLASNDYSIADIATYPWVMRWEWHDIDLESQCPNVWNWMQRIGNRPAVQKGMTIPVMS